MVPRCRLLKSTGISDCRRSRACPLSRLLFPQLVELLNSLFQHTQQALLALGIAGCPFSGTERGLNQCCERTKEGKRLWPAPTAPIAPPLGSSPDAVDGFLFSLDFLQTFRGQSVKLSSILHFRAKELFVFQLLQSRVDSSSTGSIETS